MKSVLLVSFLSSFTLFGQFLRPGVEPVMGLNYYESTDLHYQPIDYQGVSIYYGIRGHMMIGNRISLSVGTGIKNYPFDTDYYLSSSLRAYLVRNYDTGFSFFCEAGAEISDWGGLTIPFYIGTSQYFAKNLSFNFRLRLPTFLDVLYTESAGHIETGIEAGLQFDITKKKKKSITRSGNPFILN